MRSTREGTVEHNIPSRLKCAEHCLFRLRKELKFVPATHSDGRVYTRGGAGIQPGVARGAVRPSVPIAKYATEL